MRVEGASQEPFDGGTRGSPGPDEGRARHIGHGCVDFKALGSAIEDNRNCWFCAWKTAMPLTFGITASRCVQPVRRKHATVCSKRRVFQQMTTLRNIVRASRLSPITAAVLGPGVGD